jgi:hypothetical protein
MKRSKFDKLVDGLVILQKHAKGSGDFSFQHDEAYFPGPKNLPAEDLKTLKDCGFSWDDEYECWSKLS